MNIIDAINSGKKVRRKSPLFGIAFGYIKETPSGVKFFYPSKNYQAEGVCDLIIADILANDWEVEVIKKEFSAEDIRNACHAIQFPLSCLNELIEQLGL